jgi:16S rRNA G1207 methylase RsmC
MRFELSHALFSSNDIDAGSKLLLKAVAKAADPTAVETILDIGSGVGVLGIACALGYPGSALSLRDRDALACAFSSRNAKLNKLRPQSVDTALFLEGLAGSSYDLVLCNVPAKAGPPVLDRFFRELPGIVSGRGLAALVVVNTIAEAAKASLAAGGADPIVAEQSKGHTVFIVRSEGRNGFREEPDAFEGYARGLATVERGPGSSRRSNYRHKGYWGLPEFDTPSFATVLAMELVEAGASGLLARRACVINPGSGRLPCFIRSRLGAYVDLCGRDALALKASAANLALNGQAGRPEAAPADEFSAGAAGSAGSAGSGGTAGTAGAVGTVGAVGAVGAAAADGAVAWPEDLPEAAYDLVAEFADVTPRVDGFEASWLAARRALKLGASYVAVMTSADFDRFEKRKPKGFAKLREKKKKGWTAGLWRLDSVDK